MAAVERVVDASLWSVFTAKAELVGAAVMRTASQDTALTLLGEATSGFACTASASKRYPELDRHAARGSAEPEVEAALPATEVVAVASFAVAETGSVALDEPAADRGACFLAERLWVLVPESEIVPTLDLGVQRMHELVRGGSAARRE